jgi:hypothetical protein
MLRRSYAALRGIAMALVVVASNILVQFPVQGYARRPALADMLTWGAFTYPFAFLVTDLANRREGPAFARRVVFFGFMLAAVSSLIVCRRFSSARPDRVRDRRRGCAHRDRVGCGLPRPHSCSTSPCSTGSAARAGGARPSSARFPARSSIRRSSSPSRLRRLLPSPWSDRRRFRTRNRASARPFHARGPALVSWAIGDFTVKLLIAVFALIPYRLIAARWSQPRKDRRPGPAHPDRRPRHGLHPARRACGARWRRADRPSPNSSPRWSPGRAARWRNSSPVASTTPRVTILTADVGALIKAAGRLRRDPARRRQRPGGPDRRRQRRLYDHAGLAAARGR